MNKRQSSQSIWKCFPNSQSSKDITREREREGRKTVKLASSQFNDSSFGRKRSAKSIAFAMPAENKFGN